MAIQNQPGSELPAKADARAGVGLGVLHLD